MNAKIKDYIGAVVVIALLAISYAALSYANTYSKVIEPSSFRSFSVSGEGKVVAVPDIAQFTFSVVTEGGSDLNTLQAKNTNNINRGIDFIKSKGVEEKDIKTQNYSVEPRYQYFNCSSRILPLGVDGTPTPCPPPEIVGYTIRQTVAVKVRDFSIIGKIIAGVVENGANSVSQLSFTIDDPAKIESEARAKAIEQAREKAEEIARAGKFQVGKLLSIDESGYPGPIYYARGGDFAVAESVKMSAPAPAIEPGSEDVTINVILRYEIR
jgi:uncharacterized protein